MQLSQRTLKELRIIINGDDTDDYRSGPQLVDFFNDLGFKDIYGQGFPSRWVYTEQKLKIINGSSKLDKCIKKVFSVVNYIERIDYLDKLIAYFNQYLAFDKWKVVRNNDEITFKRIDKVIIDSPKEKVDGTTDDDFLSKTFNIHIVGIGLPEEVNELIEKRLTEAEKCVESGVPLSAVIMIGSIMEGLLLGTATSYPRLFNRADCAPKNKDGSIKKFQYWKLYNYIDVATEIGFLKQDVKKFSHVVRDFRNYIHPYSQLATGFNPDKHTALICLQVLKAAIYQISDYRKQLQEEAKNG